MWKKISTMLICFSDILQKSWNSPCILEGFSNHPGSCSYPSSMRLHQSVSLSASSPFQWTVKPMQPLLEISVSLSVFYTGRVSLVFSPLRVSHPGKSISAHPSCRRTEEQCMALTTLARLYYSSLRMRKAWMRVFMPHWENSPAPKGKLLLTGV